MTELLNMSNIQSEIDRGFSHLKKYKKVVSIFGSARIKEEHPDYKSAQSLSRIIAKNAHTVFTGGGGGIMEAASKGAFEHGLSVGLNIALVGKEQGNQFMNDSIIFQYFFIRKFMFVIHSSVFIFFPGGFGTLDELFTIATLIQTQKISQKPFILFGKKHWEPLIDFIKNNLESNGLIENSEWQFIHVVDSVEEALYMIKKLS